MEKILIWLAVIMPVMTNVLIFFGYRKRILDLYKKIIQLGIMQNMIIYDVQETIIDMLQERSKNQNLTTTESERFQKARKVLFETEENLKKSGYIKKSSF